MKYLIVAILVCQVVHGIVLKSERNQECPKLGCQQIKPIIERVSKLALLPDFVSQTLKLLEDLVKEMEKELERSAEYLLENIEPTCGNVHNSLKKILKLKTTNEERRAKHLELGMGLEPVSKHTEKPKVISHQSNRNEKDPYQKNYDDDYYAGSRERYEGGSSSKTEKKWEQGNFIPSSRPGESSKKYSSSSHKKTDEYSKVKYYGDKYDRNYNNKAENQKSGRSHQTSTWNQKNYEDSSYSQKNDQSNEGVYDPYENKNYGQSKEDSYDQSYNKHYDEYDYSQSESKWTKPKVIGRGQFHTGQAKSKPYEGGFLANKKEIPCRGVDKASPFWVPGLDDWCVKNCASGYCPETHCIC